MNGEYLDMARQVLDRQVIDCNHMLCGKVDDIEGLSYRFPLSRGEYDVFLKRKNGFLVYFAPAGNRQPMPLTDELPEP